MGSVATWIVAGLGNPGERYAYTRHNTGFMVVDTYARKQGLAVSKSGHQALYAELRVGEHRVVLLKPQTYMNLSGQSVAAAARWYKVEPQQVLVIYDDLDLPLGTLRLRLKGSSGGHNGVRSIIEHLGTEEFPRIRVGIGRPAAGESVVDWVLSPFTEEEKPVIAAAVERAAEALDTALRLGFVAAMNRYNR
nr:MAG: aminoacyl-tRNA hydrolase [Bacillota bacterium]